YNDLLHPTELRDYFKVFGADIPGNRISFKSLVESYFYLVNSRNLDSRNKLTSKECITYLSDKFPAGKEANNLKSAVLDSSTKKFNYSFPRFDEGEVLLELSITMLFGSFDYSKLRYKERFFDLFSSDINKTIDLLNLI